jgi:outer membrane protein
MLAKVEKNLIHYESYCNNRGVALSVGLPFEVCMIVAFRSVPKTISMTLPFLFALATVLPSSSPALTLEEAISLAQSNLPAYLAQASRVDSSDARYKATIGPYLPSVDASGTTASHNTSGANYSSNVYDVTASLKLFDYKRGPARDISRYDLNAEQEGLKKSLLDLQFDVKSSFYIVLASRGILKQRELQLDNARKNYAVAEGRRKFGVAKLSDVLQVSVRLEQARFNLVQSEGTLQKSLSELSSLIGRPVVSAEELRGEFSFEIPLPDERLLSEAQMRRPELLQAELAVKRAESNQSLATGDFFPVISGNLRYSKSDDTIANSIPPFVNPMEDRSATMLASWNLFDLGKFYRRKAASIDILTSGENLKETKRRLQLDLRKSYEDFATASRNVKVAIEQDKQAQQNYDQAFGEYKVGKGDILSLVFAETLLSQAREQLVSSALNLYLSKALLERTAGIENLEGLPSAAGSER